MSVITVNNRRARKTLIRRAEILKCERVFENHTGRHRVDFFTSFNRLQCNGLANNKANHSGVLSRERDTRHVSPAVKNWFDPINFMPSSHAFVSCLLLCMSKNVLYLFNYLGLALIRVFYYYSTIFPACILSNSRLCRQLRQRPVNYKKFIQFVLTGLLLA